MHGQLNVIFITMPGQLNVKSVTSLISGFNRFEWQLNVLDLHHYNGTNNCRESLEYWRLYPVNGRGMSSYLVTSS
jgi:hypothetical protein